MYYDRIRWRIRDSTFDRIVKLAVCRIRPSAARLKWMPSNPLSPIDWAMAKAARTVSSP